MTISRVSSKTGPVKGPRVNAKVLTMAERRSSDVKTPKVRWCFTLNNYTEEDEGRLVGLYPDKVKYLVVSRETAETTGTKHLQGYMELTKKSRAGPVEKLFEGRAHLESAAGDWESNYRYITKQEGQTGYSVTELGEPTKAGSRSDLKKAASLIVSGARMRDVACENPETYIQHSTGMHKLSMILRESKRARTTRGIWLKGSHGTGKSHIIRTLFESDELFDKSSNKWWDGYDGESYVLLDDIDKQMSKSGHSIKRWMDKWEATGEIKGATVPLAYDFFFVTSNYSPHEIWEDDYKLCEAIESRCLGGIIEMFSREEQSDVTDLIKRIMEKPEDFDSRIDPVKTKAVADVIPGCSPTFNMPEEVTDEVIDHSVEVDLNEVTFPVPYVYLCYMGKKKLVYNFTTVGNTDGVFVYATSQEGTPICKWSGEWMMHRDHVAVTSNN